MKKISLLFLSLSLATYMWAWGQMGHRVVAEVAYHYLSPEACADVDEVLGTHGMVYWSTWPDELKSSDGLYATSPDWHYQDMPANQTDAQITYFRMHYPSEGGQLWSTYDQLLTLLPEKLDNYDINGEQLTYHDALVFLVHLSGDICCPVHCGRISDKGGNMIKMEWFGDPINLHKLWDEGIILRRGYSYSEYAQMLVDKYGSEVDQMQQMSPEDQAVLIYKTMKDIYEYMDKVSDNSHRYLWDWQEKCDRLLFIAGVRLANNIANIR